jgi:transposase
MGKPLSLDLRRRIVACVEAGHSRRAAATKFDVSPSFVVELMRRYRETGSLEPARQGRPPGGRLTPLQGYLVKTVEARPDITMPELAALVEAEHGISADPSWFSRCLISLGFSYKKIADRDGARTRSGAARTPCLDPPAPAPDARSAASAGVYR